MNITVPLHDAIVARSHPKPQASPGWSAFFQSLSQGGQSLAPAGPDHIPPVAPSAISRFATSA